MTIPYKLRKRRTGNASLAQSLWRRGGNLLCWASHGQSLAVGQKFGSASSLQRFS